MLVTIISGSVSSTAQSCLTVDDPMDCSTPGFPVHQQLPEPAQTYFHRGSDAFQPSHPLSTFSSCLHSFSASGTFQLVGASQQVRTSLVAQTVKHLSTMRETWVRSLGREDLLEKEVAIHSSTITWKIPWTQEPGRLKSMGPQGVGND